MSLDYILLGMLRDPAAGYDLRKAFDAGPRHFWSAELSQIYPALQAMRKRGWLTSRREPSNVGPARLVYRRTPAGTRALHAWLKSAPEVSTERLAYIGQLVFLHELDDPKQSREFLVSLRDRLSADHSRLAQAEQALRAGRSAAPRGRGLDELHELFCLRLGLRSLEGKVAACEESLRILGAWRRSRR